MDPINTLPEWKNPGAEPPEELRNEGFKAGYKPPADYFNWFWHNVGKSVREIAEKLKEIVENLSKKADKTTVQEELNKKANADVVKKALEQKSDSTHTHNGSDIEDGTITTKKLADSSVNIDKTDFFKTVLEYIDLHKDNLTEGLMQASGIVDPTRTEYYTTQAINISEELRGTATNIAQLFVRHSMTVYEVRQVQDGTLALLPGTYYFSFLKEHLETAEILTGKKHVEISNDMLKAAFQQMIDDTIEQKTATEDDIQAVLAEVFGEQ